MHRICSSSCVYSASLAVVLMHLLLVLHLALVLPFVSTNQTKPNPPTLPSADKSTLDAENMWLIVRPSRLTLSVAPGRAYLRGAAPHPFRRVRNTPFVLKAL